MQQAAISSMPRHISLHRSSSSTPPQLSMWPKWTSRWFHRQSSERSAIRWPMGPVVIVLVHRRRKSAWLLSLWKKLPICDSVSATTSSYRTSWWIWSRTSDALTKKRGGWTRTTSHVSMLTFDSSKRLDLRLTSSAKSITIESDRTLSLTLSLIGSVPWSVIVTSTSSAWNTSTRSVRTRTPVCNLRNVRQMTNWQHWENETAKTWKKSIDWTLQMRWRRTRVMTWAATSETLNSKLARLWIKLRSSTDWLIRRHSIWRARSSNLPSVTER